MQYLLLQGYYLKTYFISYYSSWLFIFAFAVHWSMQGASDGGGDRASSWRITAQVFAES